jgi:phenylalanyl-tRNA synthetase beta chain
VGKLHPRIQKHLGISSEAYLFHVDFSEIVEVRLPKHTEVSKFPEVRRDLAFLVDAAIPAQSLVDGARAAAGEHLIDLKLFDVYQSKDVDNKGKSIALGLTFQNDSRTLTDEEINHAIDCVVQELAKTCDAELRA